jgi:phage gp29-like protein
MGVEPRPFQLAYHRYAARSGHDTRNGLLRVVAYMFLFKNFAVKDWVTFNEIFGMPLRLGKYDPSASKEDIAALKEAIRSLGSDAAGVISKTTEIEFVEAAGRLTGSYNPYEVMADFCNREMSKAVLGQTLTTDTKGSTGTYAAGKVHADVRRDLVEADAKAIAKTIRQQILRPLVGYNFGWDKKKKVPRFALLIQDAPDLKEDSEVVKNLKEAGFGKRIPLRWANDHFGIPEPKEGEETLGDAPPPEQGPGARGQGSEKGPQAGTPAPRAMRLILPLRDGELELIPQDAQVIQTQQELDQLARAALEASAAAAAQMLAPVLELIEQGAGLEEIMRRLQSLYPELESGGQEEALYQAMVLAHLRARLQ